MILKRYGRTIKKGWSYQGKLILNSGQIMMPTYATTSSRQSGYCSSTLSYQSDSIRLVQQIAMSSQYSHIGADATAGRTAIEQMRSKKLTMIPLGPSILFGDNKNTNSSSMPQAKLHKRHLMLSYTTTSGNHLQRESIYAHS